MRLIDADALKKAFYNQECWNCVIEHIIDNAPTVEYPFYQEAYQTGYEEGKNERPQGEWISVSENLPPNYIRCLFCDIDGDIYYGHRNSENRWYAEYLDDKIKGVIAWRPLPKPYKKGGAS